MGNFKEIKTTVMGILMSLLSVLVVMGVFTQGETETILASLDGIAGAILLVVNQVGALILMFKAKWGNKSD